MHTVEDEKEVLDLTTPESEELSPYEPGYPIRLLANGLKSQLAKADAAIDEIAKVVIKEAPELAQAHQAIKKGFRYVLDASDSMLESLDAGKTKLTIEKSGEMHAQIRNANGRYGSKIPIKREDFRNGFDPVQMANAIQMKALQEQMQSIADQIVIIDGRVKDILQGQQNDRIGIFQSGMTLFLEAEGVSDPELKKLLTAQSLRALSESTFQLALEMQSCIRYLESAEYKKGKSKRVELMDEKMRAINQCFAFIHQASVLRAGIYCKRGELSAMSVVLDEYSRFIEGAVASHASLLAQCDLADNGTETGIWKSRAKLQLDVSDLMKRLNAPTKILYLDDGEKEKQ